MLNPNVAIELGYALAHVGNQGVLMVLNSAYGDRESLPFDLRHKAGPIIFPLILTLQKRNGDRPNDYCHIRLRAQYVIASPAQNIKFTIASPEHIEIQPKANSAIYFEYGETLAERRRILSKFFQVRYDSGPLLYLRIIPKAAVPEIKEKDIKDIIYGIKLNPFR